MRDLIRKIIKEEMDWVSDTPKTRTKDVLKDFLKALESGGGGTMWSVPANQPYQDAVNRFKTEIGRKLKKGVRGKGYVVDLIMNGEFDFWDPLTKTFDKERFMELYG